MSGEFLVPDQKTLEPVSLQPSANSGYAINLEGNSSPSGAILGKQPATMGTSSASQPLSVFNAHIAYITDKTFPGLIKRETMDKIGESLFGPSNLVTKVNSPQSTANLAASTPSGQTPSSGGGTGSSTTVAGQSSPASDTQIQPLSPQPPAPARR